MFHMFHILIVILNAGFFCGFNIEFTFIIKIFKITLRKHHYKIIEVKNEKINYNGELSILCAY